MSTAGGLKCPNCGARVAPDHAHCEFCGVALATQTCPSCLRTVFVGFEHCPECGAEVVRPGVAAQASCPSCKQVMSVLQLGDAQANQCGQCFGLWIEPAAFGRICQNTEDHAAVFGAPSLFPADPAHRELAAVRYLPCPACAKLMNRTNFARCSGVIIDTCKHHGIWFDRDELHAIVKFIEAGGMDKSRALEADRLAEQSRELASQQSLGSDIPVNPAGLGPTYLGPADTFDPAGVLNAVGSIVSLLKHLF
jgi:Zn-finger nucleic acid-binding protein